MKRQEPENIGDILRSMLEESCMTARLRESRACELWKEVVGPDIASLCSRPTISNGLMSVGVKAAPLRQELLMSRSSIIRIINDTIGTPVVREIRFTS